MFFLLNLTRRIFSKEQRRFIKFCLVGGSGVPINLGFTNLGFYALFAGLDMAKRQAFSSIFGIIISIFSNFILNDYWTWKDRKSAHSHFLKRLIKFYLISSLSSGVQFGTAMVLMRWNNLNISLAQLVGIALATVINYLVNNFWTFKAHPEKTEPSPEEDIALPDFIESRLHDASSDNPSKPTNDVSLRTP